MGFHLVRALAISFCTLVLLVPSVAADPPAAPTDLTATVNATGTSIALSWSAPDSGLYTYSVFRGSVHVADVTDTEWTDSSPALISAYTVTSLQGTAESPATFLVVNTVGFCGTVPVVGRDTVYLTSSSVLDCGPASTNCDIQNPVSCVPLPSCEPLLVNVLPPDVDVREECLPDHSTGARTFQVTT